MRNIAIRGRVKGDTVAEQIETEEKDVVSKMDKGNPLTSRETVAFSITTANLSRQSKLLE